MSCSPAKKAARAEKKAHKKLDKSIMTDPSVFVRRCAFQFDNTDSIHEKIVYKPGETKYDTITEVQLEVLNDTVYLTKVKTVTVTKVDTVDMSRYQREVNAAALDSLNRYWTIENNALRSTLNERDKTVAVQDSTIKRQRKIIYTLSGILVLILVIWLFKSKIGKWFGAAKSLVGL